MADKEQETASAQTLPLPLNMNITFFYLSFISYALTLLKFIKFCLNELKFGDQNSVFTVLEIYKHIPKQI